MPANELTVAYANHTIHVARTPSGGARLYVNEELVDTTNDLDASEDEATLVGVFGDYLKVEAFVKPSQISVRINGVWINGERTYAAASD